MALTCPAWLLTPLWLRHTGRKGPTPSFALYRVGGRYATDRDADLKHWRTPSYRACDKRRKVTVDRLSSPVARTTGARLRVKLRIGIMGCGKVADVHIQQVHARCRPADLCVRPPRRCDHGRGTTGFVGSAVVRALLTRTEHEHISQVRTGSNRSRLQPLLHSAQTRRAEVVAATLLSRADCAKLVSAADIIHCAARMGGGATNIYNEHGRRDAECARCDGKWPAPTPGAGQLVRGCAREGLWALPTKRRDHVEAA